VDTDAANVLCCPFDAGLIGDVPRQVREAGHDVRHSIGADREIADVFVPKTADWRTDVEWADVFGSDDITSIPVPDHRSPARESRTLRNVGRRILQEPMRGGLCPEDDDSWHTYHLDAGETPTEAIPYAVSGVTNTPVTELDSLYESIDPSALTELLRHADAHDSDFAIRFNFGGCEVIMEDHCVHVQS